MPHFAIVTQILEPGAPTVFTAAPLTSGKPEQNGAVWVRKGDVRIFHIFNISYASWLIN